MKTSLCAASAFLLLASSAMATETITYTYDAKGRLVSTAHSGTVNNGVSSCYGFDNAENRTGVAVTTGGAACVPPPVCNSVTTQMGSIQNNGAPVGIGTSTTQILGLCSSAYSLTVTSPAMTNGSYSTSIGPNSTVTIAFTVSDGHGGVGSGAVIFVRH